MYVRWLLAVTLLCNPASASAAALDPLLEAAGLVVADMPGAATDFELSDHQGNAFRLHDQRGKVVFVNFWATWCPPCIHEMPMMEQLYQSLRQRPFAIWAVNMQESREDVASFMENKRFHFPALLDHEGSVTALYQVQGLPTTYLIDCAGHVIGHVVGMVQWTNDATRKLVATLLNSNACDKPSITTQ